MLEEDLKLTVPDKYKGPRFIKFCLHVFSEYFDKFIL